LYPAHRRRVNRDKIADEGVFPEMILDSGCFAFA
jgi:hypothetical protein